MALNFGQQTYSSTDEQGNPIYDQVAPVATTPAPVAPPPPAAQSMTVNDLYTQVLGRAPDQEGLQFWQGAFGAGPVTADQQASFMQAAQGELANRSTQEQALLAPKVVDPAATGVSNADILGWFNANPNADDATIARVMKEAAVSPEQVAAATGTNFADVNNRYLAATQMTPVAVQQQIIADERKRATDGIASLTPQKPIDTSETAIARERGFGPVDLGNGTYRTYGGTIIDKDGRPVVDKTKVVNDLYATIGRAGMGTGTNQIDQGGFNHFKNMLDTGMTVDQVKTEFQKAVNQYLIDKPTDEYSKYVAPIYLKSIADKITGDTTLSAFDKNNKIFETAQSYGMDDAAIDKAFGKTAADAYRKDYGNQIKSFITTTLGKDEGTTFDEIATIKNEARTRGLDATEVAKYSGMNKTGVDSLFDAYDKGLANLAKGFEDAKTKAGTDTTALSEAEANKAKTMLALQNKYKVTDEDLAKAGNTTVKVVQDYLNPVKDAPKTLEALMNDTKMSAAEIRAKIEELKAHPAVSGIYGAALQKFSDKAAKDYSGEYGGKNYESLNPIAVSTVLEQLKAQQKAGTEQYYQGGASGGKKGGFGSLDAMTEDMAKNLVAAGITDIRQVGEIPVYSPVEEIGKTYNGKRVVTQSDEDGRTFTYYVEPGEPDYEGNATSKFVALPKDAKLESIYGIYDGNETTTPVDSSKVTKDKDGKLVAQTGTTAGNKTTGEPLSKASNYSERTGGNSWSGTFRGKGNTGYNVQFKDGNPIFYTSGASSSDMVDLAPVLAMASFIPGVAPFAQAINALYAASEGNWKQALLSALPAGGEIAKTLGASAGTVANIGTASKIANVANAIDNKDLLGLAMSGTGLASDKNLFGPDAFNPSANVVGDFSTKDLLSGASILKAIENKDLTSLANVAAQMSGSKDAATAAKGLSLVNALKSNNPMALAQIASKFNLTNDVIGKAGGGLASLPGLIKNGNKNTLTDKSAFDGLNGSLVAKMLNQQPPAIRAAMLKKMTQAA